MKVALVHDWLNVKHGGAENVLIKLANLYPEADIFTLVYNPDLFDSVLGGRNIHTSWLNHFPKAVKHRPHLLLPFIMSAVKSWNFNDYDVVITSSTAWVKNIETSEETLHICYCHSPARMLWDSWPGYLDKHKLGALRRYYIIKLSSKLRLWDYYQSQAQNTKFVANSQYVAGRISKFYHRKAEVIYPPVTLVGGGQVKKEDYYLIVSVLAKYKNIDLAVQAFKASGKKLLIAGSGPDEERLRALADGIENIQFLGRVAEAAKHDLYQKARAFVFCSVEDFGITMAEAISASTPVIALRGGGAEEIIREGKSGLFFDKPNEESLNRCIDKFEKELAGKEVDFSYIESFSNEQFAKRIKRLVG